MVENTRDPVWLVWDGSFLHGLFASQWDAEKAADRLQAMPLLTVHAGPTNRTTRIEPWVIGPFTPRPSKVPVGLLRQKALDVVHRDWELLTIPDLGTAHMFLLDTYLAVPHLGVLKFPGFQFNQSRELWPGFRDVLRIFRDAGWDEFAITMWFVSHQGAADGAIPAVLLQDQVDEVLRAARISTFDAR